MPNRERKMHGVQKAVLTGLALFLLLLWIRSMRHGSGPNGGQQVGNPDIGMPTASTRVGFNVATNLSA